MAERLMGRPSRRVLYLIVPSMLLIAGALQPAEAKTLCVNPQGTSGCYSTISAAVAAASPGDTINVGPGTYKEMVTIKKPLSLVGAAPDTTVIDAKGLPNAIYINNPSVTSPAVGVSDVVVTGFTLENADFEGVLVNGASSVTIWGNRVTYNDESLEPSPTTPACPDLTTVYPFETSEADDCGEGIHLTNVNSSVVAFNTVEGNAGGILVSDDSGPTHDNSVSKNVVINNVLDCGITIPSHSPFGVYHNTVSGNEVAGNGTSPADGFGAGVGLFSPAGPTRNYGNSVVHNDLVGNGIAGVAIHTHAPGTEELQDEVIVGNHIARNGGDTDLGLSQSEQGDGISLLTVGGSVSGIVISENTFDDEVEDIVTSTNIPVKLTATLNNFSRGSIAVDNLAVLDGSATVNAMQDWWGCAAGPGAPGCATFQAGKGTVLFRPWLTSPVPEALFTPPSIP
jgi:hypothetical protein